MMEVWWNVSVGSMTIDKMSTNLVVVVQKEKTRGQKGGGKPPCSCEWTISGASVGYLDQDKSEVKHGRS